MNKIDAYRRTLRELEDWDAYLLVESGLPGPRGNLELAQAAAAEGDEARCVHWRTFGPDRAPTNSPDEFLCFCGVLGLGKLLATGRRDVLPILRAYASDPRWRLREATAMALQQWGDVAMDDLLDEMTLWSQGVFLEQRAAAAALCEPRLLRQPHQVERVFVVLDAATTALQNAEQRSGDDFRVLRAGLGYCWSVAVAAQPEVGKARMERWLSSGDKDVRWVMKENLAKKRLERMDTVWLTETRARWQL